MSDDNFARLPSNPLVSVGVPTYNRPDDLRKTLDCLINQTYLNLEIIVSDNASPGNMVEEIVREFMVCDSRIRYFRQPENRGAVFNFQFVLERSQGEYFMWAADDDWRESHFIEQLLVQLLKDSQASIAFCDFQELDTSGQRHSAYRQHLPLLHEFTTQNKWLRLWHYFMQAGQLGKANLIYGLMRRSDLIGFNWERFAQQHGSYGLDMLLVYQMLNKGRLALVDELLYGCTVGNVKHYGEIVSSNKAKLMIAIDEEKKVLRSFVQYWGVTKGIYKSMFLIGLPLKVTIELGTWLIMIIRRKINKLRNCKNDYS